MNLLVSENLAAVRPDRLPPAKRDGPARVLFLSADALGWRVSSRQLIDATATRPDVAAVHVLLQWPRWMKLLNRRVPGRNHLVHPSTTWHWLMRRWLTGPLDAGRFDVIHANSQITVRAAADLKPRFGYKLSVTCDTTERQYARELSTLASDEVNDVAVFGAADSVAALSRWCAASVRDDYGVDAGKILLIPPTVAAPAGLPSRGAGPLKRIVFVGNDFARKGGPRLLRWHQDRWADRAELHVASAEAADHAPLKNVTFHGRLDHDAVIRLIADADLMVHPTQSDMSALVVAEAQTLGVPAVASRLAGIPDLLRDGESGLLVDPDDDAGFVAAVESILFDEPRRLAMAAAARAFAAAELNSDVVYGRLIDRLVALADGRA